MGPGVKSRGLLRKISTVYILEARKFSHSFLRKEDFRNFSWYNFEVFEQVLPSEDRWDLVVELDKDEEKFSLKILPRILLENSKNSVHKQISIMQKTPPRILLLKNEFQ